MYLTSFYICVVFLQLHFWMGANHNYFSQFSSENDLCFAPIRANLDGETTLHLTVFYFHKYLFLHIYILLS
jgi:hypothetical protein